MAVVFAKVRPAERQNRLWVPKTRRWRLHPCKGPHSWINVLVRKPPPSRGGEQESKGMVVYGESSDLSELCESDAWGAL